MSANETEKGRLRVVSQTFRYCDYGQGQGQTRALRLGVRPVQFVVQISRDASLADKEVEIQVEIRNEQTNEPVFETLWVTTLAHAHQESAQIFDEFPPELAALEPGGVYGYYASALINETGDFAERATRVTAH